MHIGNGAGNAADRMRLKRLSAAALVACLGAGLAACAGSGSENGVSSYVADHWPHWAGGMPPDVPPRPGQPGYAEFIAHGQADQAPAKTVAPGSPGSAAPNAVPPNSQAPTFVTAPAAKPAALASVPAPSVAAQPTEQPTETVPEEDMSAVRGGLY